jgi:hypothetical protein
MPQEVLDETPDRSKATIARDRAVASHGLHVLEERQHGLDLDVVEPQVGDGSASPFCQEQEEEAEPVSVRTDRMLAGAAHAPEMGGKEALYEREKGVGLALAHGLLPPK